MAGNTPWESETPVFIMENGVQASEHRSDPEPLLILPTTHHTLLAEEALRSENIRYLPVPKPDKIASDCAMAIRIDGGDLRRAAKALEKMDVKFFLTGVDGAITPIEPEDIP